MTSRLLATALLLSPLAVCTDAETIDVAPLLATLRKVGPRGQGHREAIAAGRTLAQADPEQLPEILAGMDGANPLAMNWIHGAADAVAQRALTSGRFPEKDLERFLAETEHNPRARRLAFELLERRDPSVRSRLIPTMLNDPSLELRRDAVAHVLQEAADVAVAGTSQEAIAAYRLALNAARDVDQIDAATKSLEKLGVVVDLPKHFGFITRWMLVGPFDNSNGTGFAAVFLPEMKVDLGAKCAGKLADIGWNEHTTRDKYGMVDLNTAIGKYNGVTAYAFCEFVSAEERDVELRLGCINANKVWLNGRLLTTNEVYHANTKIDQYIGRGRLRQGPNAILVKVCQNEQTEDWAQRWQFQLRVCDEYGAAVLAENREVQ